MNAPQLTFFQARSEMCGRGLHLVFYKTLEPLIWQRSAKLVEPGIHCLIKLLHVTERGYTRSTDPGLVSLYTLLIKLLIMIKC